MLLLRCKTATGIFILTFLAHLSSGASYADDYDLSGSEDSDELSDVLENPEESVYDDENESVGSDESADIYFYRRAETPPSFLAGSIYNRGAKSPLQSSRTEISDTNARRRSQKLKNPRADADAESDAEISEDVLGDNNDADYDEVYIPPTRRESFIDGSLRRSDVTDQPPIDPRSLPSSNRKTTTARPPTSRRTDSISIFPLRRSDGIVKPGQTLGQQPPIDPRSLSPSKRKTTTTTARPTVDPRLPTSRRADGRVTPSQQPPIDPRSLSSSKRKTTTARPPIDPRLAKSRRADTMSIFPLRRSDGIVAQGQTSGQKPPIDRRYLLPFRRADEINTYNPRALRPSRRVVMPGDNANQTVPRPTPRRRDLRPKNIILDNSRR